MFLALLKEKEQGHHDQRHVVMPSLPTAGLVLGHSGLSLGVLKSALDPVALTLDLGEPACRGFSGCITQAVFQARRIAGIAGHQQVPAAGRGFSAIPQPDHASHHIQVQLAFRRMTNPLPLPSRLRPLWQPSIHSHRFHLGNSSARTSRRRSRNLRLRVFGVDALIAMDIDDEDFARIVQALKKCWVVPITTISGNPTKAKALSPRSVDHLKSQFRLGLKRSCRFRNTRLTAALRRVGPLAGQVQPGIDQGRAIAVTEAGENAHLTAVGLAPSSAPLPGHPDRFLPLLRETRLVDNQARIQGAESRVPPSSASTPAATWSITF